ASESARPETAAPPSFDDFAEASGSVSNPTSSANIPGTESHEEAAQRIDAWFRSAKTLSDIPPAAEQIPAREPDLASRAESTTQEHDYIAPESGDEAVENAGLSGDERKESDLGSDFMLEAAVEALPQRPAWDDSQHMDQLLADLEQHPVDEFAPSGHET